jgi:hypothetical protein
MVVGEKRDKKQEARAKIRDARDKKQEPITRCKRRETRIES